MLAKNNYSFTVSITIISKVTSVFSLLLFVLDYFPYSVQNRIQIATSKNWTYSEINLEQEFWTEINACKLKKLKEDSQYQTWF